VGRSGLHLYKTAAEVRWDPPTHRHTETCLKTLPVVVVASAATTGHSLGRCRVPPPLYSNKLGGVGREERGAAEGPVLCVLVGGAFERDEEDEEAVGAGAVFIDWARVGPMRPEQFLAALLRFSLNEAGDEEDGEGDVEFLGLGLDEQGLFFCQRRRRRGTCRGCRRPLGARRGPARSVRAG